MDLTGSMAEEAGELARRSDAAGRHLVLVEEQVEAIAIEGEFSARLPAPMNLEIFADHPFRARGFFCEDRLGWIGHCEVPSSQMRATSMGQGAADEPGVCIWVIAEGNLAMDLPSGIQARFGPGSVLLLDGAQSPSGRWDHARFGYVRLSPLRMKQLLGHAPPGRGRPVQRLEHLALAPFLAAQLNAFAIHGAGLTATDLDVVVGGVVRAAEALLRAVYAPLAAPDADPAVDRLQAVYRYIERNLHRQDLDVADIARGTSMSRAQLYRLFAAQETSVHGTLREKRLQKSMGYLKQPESEQLSIGAIAYACGFSDPAVFSKLFRQRFQLAPREVRAAARPTR